MDSIKRKGVQIMKPQYWIGILAIVGSLLGTAIGIIFPNIHGAAAASIGTIIGVVAGTIVFSSLRSKNKDK